MDQAQASTDTKKGITKTDLACAAAITTIFTNLLQTYAKQLAQDAPSFLTALLTESNIAAMASIVTVVLTWLLSNFNGWRSKRHKKMRFDDKLAYLDYCIGKEHDENKKQKLQQSRSELIEKEVQETVKH
ncbi:hypothetical protein ACPF0Q_000682 [Vibrio cholerae]|uniref:hypothetical protein n=1 Tax=Vibrio cholerae TaxID=666 RepID=UPI0013731581|nr:hypothetical protein [Vibrio cholerae]EGR4408007.1 hypothetical protein [Vibrio cholerae]MCX9527045.1 hypothetical protein [Vibrio cholerae]NAR21296.1 hypothetical protein [Vibrio cholerae]NAR32522.1 hypothetical protein [Vibrio cholerae]